MGSKTYDRTEGWPTVTNILTRIDKLARNDPSARTLYDSLCEATHPNIESHAVFWRSDTIKLGTHAANRFAPGNSNSPIKIHILDAVQISLHYIIPFTRDLWWIAADITNTCNMTESDRTRILGLPARTGRTHPCSCGSGEVTRSCTHPEPWFDSAIEVDAALDPD